MLISTVSSKCSIDLSLTYSHGWTCVSRCHKTVVKVGVARMCCLLPEMCEGLNLAIAVGANASFI